MRQQLCCQQCAHRLPAVRKCCANQTTGGSRIHDVLGAWRPRGPVGRHARHGTCNLMQMTRSPLGDMCKAIVSESLCSLTLAGLLHDTWLRWRVHQQVQEPPCCPQHCLEAVLLLSRGRLGTGCRTTASAGAGTANAVRSTVLRVSCCCLRCRRTVCNTGVSSWSVARPHSGSRRRAGSSVSTMPRHPDLHPRAIASHLRCRRRPPAGRPPRSPPAAARRAPPSGPPAPPRARPPAPLSPGFCPGRHHPARLPRRPPDARPRSCVGRARPAPVAERAADLSGTHCAEQMLQHVLQFVEAARLR